MEEHFWQGYNVASKFWESLIALEIKFYMSPSDVVTSESNPLLASNLCRCWLLLHIKIKIKKPVYPLPFEKPAVD